MGKLKGKVALVTGGASGIGHAVVRLFAAEDASVGIIDLAGDHADKVAGEAAKAHGVGTAAAMADVGEEAALKAAIASITGKLGDIDILVNCAGMDTTSPVDEMATAMWDRMIAVHMRGTFLCCREVLPAMKRKSWGRIINVSSQLAHKGAP
ncbi:MAG: SDR family NAD(P)-dependent oxidoreductase, partial [Geminicoccaceae bacterium]